MSRHWARGSTTAWRKMRAAVLAANPGGRCLLNVGTMCPKHGKPCAGVCTGVATQVHHIKGKAVGDDPRYLQPCCRECNLHVGQPGAAAVQPTPRSTW